MNINNKNLLFKIIKTNNNKNIELFYIIIKNEY